MFTLFHRLVNCFLLSILLCFFIPTISFSQDSSEETNSIQTEKEEAMQELETPQELDSEFSDQSEELEKAFSSQPMQVFKKLKQITQDIVVNKVTPDNTTPAPSLSASQINELVTKLETILKDPVVKNVLGHSEVTQETVLSYLRTLATNFNEFEKAYSFYKRAVNYLELQYQEYVHSSFIKHLERGLFEYSEDSMLAKYLIRGNRLVISVQLSKEQKHKYLFYQYSDEEFLLDSSINTDEAILPVNDNIDEVTKLYYTNNSQSSSQLNSIITLLERQQNPLPDNANISLAKKFNEALSTLESQERINGFETTTVRLGNSFEILSLYNDKAPKFFKDPTRYIREYLKSIYEPPQFLLGMVGAFIQCSVITLIYTIKGQAFTEQIPQLALTATFATLMGSYIGSYRNYVDKGSLFKRIAKECVIGALFLYSFKILESGFASVSFLSLMGIWTNIKILGVMYLSKLFKYPYTFIPRMSKDLGYYGTEGQATVVDPIFHQKWNARNLHNQIIYNLVSFGLKIAAIIGIYTTVNLPGIGTFDLDVATLLFLSSPIIALLINNHWMEKEYRNINIKYRLDPSPTHKKGLERREKIYNRVRGYIDRIRSIYYGALGVFTGNLVLKMKEARMLKEPETDLEYLLATKPISKMSIKELRAYSKKIDEELQNLSDSEEDKEIRKYLVSQSVIAKIALDKQFREVAIIRALRTKIAKKAHQITNTIKTASTACVSLFSFM